MLTHHDTILEVGRVESRSVPSKLSMKYWIAIWNSMSTLRPTHGQDLSDLWVGVRYSVRYG